ncbi:hypothetical protein DUI87_00677 [Hirundo rustica rustica]|uniref:Uncharacterized protein n=1 Tax=Hirundo rustica rustica TaxID=333673 RepID=A0A3M0LAF1_HIRRU|nr:hypothetical protein DUI87_00677 [Hirundo rustica rustica]
MDIVHLNFNKDFNTISQRILLDKMLIYRLDEKCPESRLECLANPHVGSRVTTCFCDIEALPRAAAWQLRARPHIPYNKPHLLKPNFRDLSSTFIYTVLESSAAGGSYFYDRKEPTWRAIMAKQSF